MTPFRQHAPSPVFHRLAEGVRASVNWIRPMTGAPMVLVLYASDEASGSRSTNEGGCQISCMGFIGANSRDQTSENCGSQCREDPVFGVGWWGILLRRVIR